MNDKLKFYRSTLVQMTKGLIGYTPMHKLAEDAGKITEEIMKKVDEFEVAMEQHFTLDEKRVNYYFGGDNCVAKDFTCTDPNFFKGINQDYLKTEPMRTIVDNGPQYSSYNKEELDYVCKLTQYDIDDIETRLNQVIKYYKDLKENYITEEQFNEFTERNINCVIGYLKDEGGIRKKDQIMQLSRQKAIKDQKPYGTLGEHWKELMELFRIKVQLIDEWKSQFAIVINNLKNGKQAVDRLPSKLDDIYKKLGIEFIEDFVKACEKCEE